jgi:hypothetical protein
VQTEFASVLKIMEREGNVLSAVLREAWDTGDLNILTKNNPTRATNAHISIIGHITTEDLKRHLKSTDTANGFANRFMWVCTDRSKSLPAGGRPDAQAVRELSARIAQVISFAKDVRELRRDDAARNLWFDVYDSLSAGKYGMFGAATGRAEAQVTRLALIYAISDRSTVIRVEHLSAALALWQYAEASAKYIFGDSVGNKTADRLLAELRSSDVGLTRAAMIREVFNKNLSAADLDEALWLLCDLRLAFPIEESTGGRPAELWFSMG